MEDFKKLMRKLGKPADRPDYVRDLYDESAMNADIAGSTSMLSPEDMEKIHYAETTGGKYLDNDQSTASGHYQLIDSTRAEAEKLLKKQDLEPNHVNPLKNEAILMKALTDRYENALKNAKSGPFEPTVENMYLAHKNGITGALKALKDPKSEKSKSKFKEVDKLLARKPKKQQKEPTGANNLLELLED
jgi:hypothetical protein